MMETYLDCVPCIIEQTIKAARDLTQDLSKQEILVQNVLKTLSNISYNQSPPYLGKEVHLVIAKGHRNYETLNDIEGKKLYFLLMVKCETIARDFGCAVGEFVVKRT